MEEENKVPSNNRFHPADIIDENLHNRISEEGSVRRDDKPDYILDDGDNIDEQVVFVNDRD